MSDPTPAPRSLRAAINENPKSDRDAVLKSIAGQPVVVLSATVEPITGRFRDYDLATVYLADGRSFTVTGSAVCGPLSEVDWSAGPVEVTFDQEESTFQPGAFYWTVR